MANMPDKFFPTFGSFFISIFIYIGIIVLLFIKLVDYNQQVKKFTDDKDAFMDVLIVEDKFSSLQKQSEEKIQDVKQDLPQPKPEKHNQVADTKEPILPKENSIQEQEPDLKNLFSSIDTSKLKKDSGIQKAKPPKPPKQNIVIAKNEASKIINNLNLNTTSKVLKSQITGSYDELLGAIQKQIKRRWQSYKADSNNVALVKITIDGSGNFSYEILKLPYNNEFNMKVKECLELLKTERFPTSPDRSNVTFNLNLEDKLQ